MAPEFGEQIPVPAIKQMAGWREMLGAVGISIIGAISQAPDADAKTFREMGAEMQTDGKIADAIDRFKDEKGDRTETLKGLFNLKGDNRKLTTEKGVVMDVTHAKITLERKGGQVLLCIEYYNALSGAPSPTDRPVWRSQFETHLMGRTAPKKK